MTEDDRAVWACWLLLFDLAVGLFSATVVCFVVVAMAKLPYGYHLFYFMFE